MNAKKILGTSLLSINVIVVFVIGIKSLVNLSIVEGIITYSVSTCELITAWIAILLSYLGAYLLDNC